MTYLVQFYSDRRMTRREAEKREASDEQIDQGTFVAPKDNRVAVAVRQEDGRTRYGYNGRWHDERPKEF